MEQENIQVNTKTATIIGASGLIGNILLNLLCEDGYFGQIIVIVRKPIAFNNPKVKIIQIEFEDKDAFRNAIKGSNALFCAVGTTNNNVKGDKIAYRKVDYDIPVDAARFCEELGVKHFLLVSAIGANSQSGNFYLQLKGEVEDVLKKSAIPFVDVFQPSMLLGDRKEVRIGEKIGKILMKPLSFLLPADYKPIEAKNVAQAMIYASKLDKQGFHIWNYAHIFATSKITPIFE